MDYDLSPSVELPPLHDHPVYSQGMALIANGRWQQAFESLQLLQSIYPDDAEVKELLEQVEMRAALSQFQPRQSSRAKKRLNLRRLLAVSSVIVFVIVAAYVVYEVWINPSVVQEVRLRQITRLRNEADEAMVSGDYAQARQSLQKLQAILPEDPQTIEALRRIEQVERSSDLYNEAKAFMAAGDWDQAIAALSELESLDAEYRDLPQLLQTAQESQAMDTQFQAAEEAYNNEDWVNAIARYEALQKTSLTFRFEEIQARLFESHLRYGQAILEQAGATDAHVSDAISHFSEALRIRPMDSEVLAERHLAENYLAALTSEDQDEVIDLLQNIYNEQPGYAGNTAAQLLYATLLERADSLVDSGDRNAAIADYKVAAQLSVEDPSEAQAKLDQLVAEVAP